MLTTLLIMLLFAALFVAVGLLRTMDGRAAACHGCTRAEVGGCGARCPLIPATAVPPAEERGTRERGAEGAERRTT
jgi:hypothetical protein